MYPPATDSLHENFFVHIESNDHGNCLGPKSFVDEFRLFQGSRETIEDETPAAIRRTDSLFNEIDDQLEMP